MNALVALPVMLPLLGAALALVFRRHPRTQLSISIVTLTFVLVIATVLLARADAESVLVLRIGGWPATQGIALVADRLSALMIIVSAFVTLAVLVYSTTQGLDDRRERAPVTIYHPSYLILVAGVSNAFLAGDLFNLYVGFEILLVASYVLLTLGGTEGRIRAGTTYVMVSLLSSVIFLAAIALVYAATGTVNLAMLAVRLDAVDPDVRTTLEVMLLLAFGIKAAIFPLSSWLPDSYPTAPAPVTAVFAGLLTKVGIYAIIRVESLLFPGVGVSVPLLVLASLTMLIGVLGAVAQTDIKRVLSFTLVSHMGYMLFGIALTTQAGMAGAIYYVVHHITVQTTLFLVVGLIERRGGTTSLARLGGLARLSPIIAILFFVPAMNLGGIPPFSGFLGKVALLQAGVAVGSPLVWVTIAVALLTSLLTLYALAKVWNRAFWQNAPDDLEKKENVRLPRTMVGSTSALVAASLALTVFAGPLFALADRTSGNLLERAPYVSAVLGGSAAAGLRFSVDSDGMLERGAR